MGRGVPGSQDRGLTGGPREPSGRWLEGDGSQDRGEWRLLGARIGVAGGHWEPGQG